MMLELWNGGDAPMIDDELYLSIAEELAQPEYVLEKTWESRIPTTLTVLQSGVIGLDAEGLPCCHAGESTGFNQKPASVLEGLIVKRD